MMARIALLLLILSCMLMPARAQQTPVCLVINGACASTTNPVPTTTSGVSGSASNASSGVATSSTNVPTVSYNYVFNGTTWDQWSSLTLGSKHSATVAIVDGSGNQITSFGGGTASNASSGVATSSTNGQNIAWLYAFNGTTWDQIRIKPASTAPLATDPAVVVSLGPNSSGLITTGTAGSPGSQVVTEQGIASMTPLRTFGVPTALSEGAITPTPSGSAVASLVLKASAGNFYSASAVNVSGTSGFCLVINATAAPGSGSAVTPVFFAPLPANGFCSIVGDDGNVPSAFGTGITFLVSSNASPYTFTSGTITAAISGRAQ